LRALSFDIPPISSFARRCEKIGFSGLAVIPAKAEIQQIQSVKNILDPGFHRGDD
jgi:hypothetical protein